MVLPMDTERFTELLRSDLATMASAARSAGLAADVPTCPGWDVRDLVVHTGVVHRHKVETLLGDYTDGRAPMPVAPDQDMSDSEVMAWFDEGATALLDACTTADLDAPSWTWCEHQHTKGWWIRRMAHETVIHGIDAVVAAGGTPMIDPWLAGDGVDEILDEFMTGGPAWGSVTPLDGTIRLQTADRSWNLRMAEFSGTSPHSGETYSGLPKLVYERVDEPMAIVSSDAPTLDLWLWGRGPLPSGAITGDISVVDAMRSTAADATQ